MDDWGVEKINNNYLQFHRLWYGEYPRASRYQMHIVAKNFICSETETFPDPVPESPLLLGCQGTGRQGRAEFVFHCLGSAHQRLGQHDKAIELYRQQVVLVSLCPRACSSVSVTHHFSPFCFFVLLNHFCSPFVSRSINSMEHAQRRTGLLAISATVTLKRITGTQSFLFWSKPRLFSGRWETRRQRQDRAALFQVYTRLYASPPKRRLLQTEEIAFLPPVQVP